MDREIYLVQNKKSTRDDLIKIVAKMLIRTNS